MKFRTPLLFVTAFALLFTMNSCVKNYTCHCDIKYSGVPGLPDSTTKEYSVTDVKDKAKNVCESESGSYLNNGITTVENCYLY